MAGNKKQAIEKCLKNISDGDREAAGLLYDLTQSGLYFTAFRYLRNERDAEDLMSEFWANIYDIAKKYRFSFNAYGYLNKAVANMALMRLRKRKRLLNAETPLTAEILERYEAVSFDGSDGKVYLGELRATFDKGFGLLNHTEKSVIYLIYWEGRSIRDCARILKISKSQIGRIKKEAIEKLKAVLENDGWDKYDR